MNEIASKIAELRILVGFLGEKGQANWWASEFFSASASAFLGPIFNRSLLLAQYQGATAAAAKVHDDSIGVGCTYHLFRLPIGFEQSAADVVSNQIFVKSVASNLKNRDLALVRLHEISTGDHVAAPGPISVGRISDDISLTIKRLASIYHAALKQGIQSFPYIRELD